ncbi:MAG: HAD family hydrolase [Patescibacteria group bacterium]|jgi:hydroxymethylpyrimidine pyrophosphatase-like HAD family hydrolase
MQTALALFTDIDGTFVLDERHHLQQQENYWETTLAITAILKQYQIPLIAVTGRSVDVMLLDTAKFSGELPFNILACELGTRLYVKQPNGTYQLDRRYEQYVQETSGFKRSVLYPLCQDLEQTIQNLFPNINFQFQPQDQLNYTGERQPFKISYHFIATVQEALNIQYRFQMIFKQVGLSKLNIIVSANYVLENNLADYNLDVVAVDKKDAVIYLEQQYHYQSMVAGDGGNDIHMLLHTAAYTIIVGGYKPVLKQALTEYLHYGRVLLTTGHFVLVKNNQALKIIYLEPDPTLIGPNSLQQALLAFIALLNKKQVILPEQLQTELAQLRAKIS